MGRAEDVALPSPRAAAARPQRARLESAWLVAVCALAISMPFIAGEYWLKGILIPTLIFALAALGLNFVTGYAGLISVGQAAFMAVGAFTGVIAYGRYGIPLLPGSSLVPKSVVLQYMLTVLAGVLLWVSDSEERWVRFKEPIHAVLVEPQLKGVRTVLLGAVPLFIGFLTFRQVQASVSAPPNLRSIHPAPPASISARPGAYRPSSWKPAHGSRTPIVLLGARCSRSLGVDASR